MAKRKTRKKKSGGGAFGCSKKKRSHHRSSRIGKNFQADKNRVLGIMQREMAQQNFKSDHEAEAFLNKFTSQSFDEIIEKYDDTPEGRAHDFLAETRNALHPDEMAEVARKALQLDPENLDAKMQLAMLEPSPNKRIKMVEDAISSKRQKLDHFFVEARENELSVWGFHDVRPLMWAKHDLAILYRETGETEKSTEHFEEILELCPNDNQGIRFELLLNYLWDYDLEKADDLLSRYQDSYSCEFLYGRFYLEALCGFKKAVAAKWEPETAQKVATFPDELFGPAKRALRKAIKRFPWAAQFLIDLRVLGFEDLVSYRLGSPFEALAHGKRAHFLWSSSNFVPGFMFSLLPEFLEDGEVLERLIKERDDYQCIVEQLQGERVESFSDELDDPEIAEVLEAQWGMADSIEQALSTYSKIDLCYEIN